MATQSDRRWWRLDRRAILALTITAMICVTALVCTCIWTYGNRYQIGGGNGVHILDRFTGDVRYEDCRSYPYKPLHVDVSLRGGWR